MECKLNYCFLDGGLDNWRNCIFLYWEILKVGGGLVYCSFLRVLWVCVVDKGYMWLGFEVIFEIYFSLIWYSWVKV